MPVECTCIECNKIFKVKPYKKDSAKFCSRECQWNYKRGKKTGTWITKICPSCGKEFETLKSKEKKYCSEKCLHERNENYVTYPCDVCGKDFLVKKSIYKKLLEGKQKTLTCSYECAGKIKITGQNVSCDNCGKSIYKTKYKLEASNHNFCSHECQMEFQHKETYELRKCEICGVEFECSKISTQRFCSNKCNAKWQESIVGELNPNFTREKLSCTYCGKTIYVKQYKLNIQEHFFCNEKCRQDWYANIWSQREEWREKKRIDAVKILESGAISKVNSKPQQIVDSILDKNKINYMREKGIKYYSIDNYIEDNLMIEVQGDYWHCNPTKFINTINKTQYDRISKDKAKHTYTLNHYNTEILYIWETDLYKNYKMCEKLILEYIKRNGRLENYHSFNYYVYKNEELKLKDKLIVPYQNMDCKEYKHLLKEVS